jgi:hypothetical protein
VAAVQAKNAQGTVYRLCGVVVHRGSTAYEGHYYSFVRDVACAAAATEASVVHAEETATVSAEDLATALRGQRWRRYDDAQVCEVPGERLARETLGGDWDDSDESSSSTSSSGDDGDEGGEEGSGGSGDGDSERGTAAGNREVGHRELTTDDAEAVTAADPDAFSAAVDDQGVVVPVEETCQEPTANSGSDRSACSSKSDDGHSDGSGDESSEADSDSSSSSSSSYDSDDSSDDEGDYASAFMLFYERVE